MARFFSQIGFGTTVKKAPGVFDILVTERSYRGDVIRNARGFNETDKVLDDISVENSISIVADQYASENFTAIRYVRWAGSLWKVSNVEVQRPRLILRLGGVYNGPTAPVADTP